MNSLISRHLLLSTMQVTTETTCNKCKSKLTVKFASYWSCNTCDSWVTEVTTKQEPIKFFNSCTV